MGEHERAMPTKTMAIVTWTWGEEEQQFRMTRGGNRNRRM
jgi:hypothetical protein